MCLALSNNDALRALELFWNMPLAKLFAFAHAYMQNNGVKTKPLGSQSLLKSVFGGMGKTASNDTHESQGEWFEQELGEVDYLR
jgi:F0F1-type ATP synthase membrane subunit a